MCEKPLALDAKQAKTMYEKAESKGVKHMVDFTYRWYPVYRQLRKQIEQGYLGRCYQCNMRYLVGGRPISHQYAWRSDAKRSIGVLGDLGSHMVDLALWLVGDIVDVSARLSTFVAREGPQGNSLEAANDAANLLVRFENGAQGLIQLSGVAHVGDRLQEQHVLLHGEEGTLEADYDLKGTELRGLRQEAQKFECIGRWDVSTTDQPWAIAHQMFCTESVGPRLFIDAILKNGPASPTFRDGLKAQLVLDAAVKSHEQGGSVVRLE